MGLNVTVIIKNNTYVPINDVYSVSGDFSLCGKIKEKFLKRDDFFPPEIDYNSHKIYEYCLCPMPPVLLMLYLPGPYAKMAGVAGVTAMQYVEPALNLVLEYEDGSKDDVYFAVRVFNARPTTYDPKDTMDTWATIGVGHAIKCIQMIPIMTLADIATGGGGDVSALIDEMSVVEQNCRLCMMKVDKNSIDHTWNFHSISSSNTTELTFSDVKFNYALEMTHEMRLKAKRRMQRNRFMECVHQLMSTLAMTLAKAMTDSLTANIEQAVSQNGHELLKEAVRYQQDPANVTSTDYFFKKALACFEALKLVHSGETSKHIDHIINAIKLTLAGNIDFQTAIKMESNLNDTSGKAMKSKLSEDHQQAADLAMETLGVFRKACNNQTEAMQYYAKLGFLQPISVNNIEQLDKKVRKHGSLALKGLVPDLKFDMAAIEAMQWEGDELLEIHADVGKKSNK